MVLHLKNSIIFTSLRGGTEVVRWVHIPDVVGSIPTPATRQVGERKNCNVVLRNCTLNLKRKRAGVPKQEPTCFSFYNKYHCLI